MDIGGPRGAGTVTGIVNGVGSIGGALSPIAVARISDTFGWDALFYSLVVVALLSGVLLATQWNYGGGAEVQGKG